MDACCLETHSCKTVLRGNYTEILWRQTDCATRSVCWLVKLYAVTWLFFDEHVGINSVHVFPSPFFALQKLFCELIFSRNLAFPLIISDAILQNVHKNRVMETATVALKRIWTLNGVHTKREANIISVAMLIKQLPLQLIFTEPSTSPVGEKTNKQSVAVYKPY